MFDIAEHVRLIALELVSAGGSGITALAQPTEEMMGVSAFECLLQRLRDDDGPGRTLDFSARLGGATLGHIR